jgi:hypothetical protein
LPDAFRRTAGWGFPIEEQSETIEALARGIDESDARPTPLLDFYRRDVVITRGDDSVHEHEFTLADDAVASLDGAVAYPVSVEIGKLARHQVIVDLFVRVLFEQFVSRSQERTVDLVGNSLAAKLRLRGYRPDAPALAHRPLT